MYKYHPQLSNWRTRCDGTPMKTYGIRYLKIVKEFSILRFNKCTDEKKSQTERFLTTNFFEDLTDYKESDEKMDKLEDDLNKILADGLKLMPLMKGMSNN